MQVTDGGGVAGPALDLDATVQYMDGCLRSHTSRLSVPVVQPFRCGACYAVGRLSLSFTCVNIVSSLSL